MREMKYKDPETIPTGKHTEHGEKKEEELVRAAFDLIAERGFEGLRTREVAARAGVTVATLHYYFPTKEHLIRAVMTNAMEQFRRRRARIPSVTDRASQTELREVLQARRHQIHETPQLFIVLLELTARASRDPAIKAIMRESDANWRESISGHLSEGVAKGRFREDLDVPAAAVFLEALTRGRSMLALVNPDAQLDKRVDVEIERWLTGKPEPASG
jgi:AcrR family transcriptional regulator